MPLVSLLGPLWDICNCCALEYFPEKLIYLHLGKRTVSLANLVDRVMRHTSINSSM